MTGRIYSIGYEGLTLSGFVETLSQSGVETVYDVRLTPSSRKPGFSRTALARALDAAGIGYVHEPKLGNPRENRESFRSGDSAGGYQVMRERLDNGSGEALQRVADAALGHRIAVLCVERSEDHCHRKVITDAIRELQPEVEVIPVI